MKLGFLTACLPRVDLADIARQAVRHGYQALEVAGWPSGDGPDHIKVDRFDEAEATRVRDIFAETGLTLSSVAFYGNNLHPDHRAAVNDHVRRCVDAAAALGCPTVGTFVGRDPGLPVAANMRLAESVFPPLAEYAARSGVTIVIENCVMKSWHPDGYPGNLAYSPELWEWMFTLGLKLNYDPSHLVGLGIDPVAAIVPHVSDIAHVQAKDAEILPGRIDRYGFHGPVGGEKGWWRFRVPGLGQVDWARLVDVLYEGGYEGVVSVEHEDPVWSGDDERVWSGLRIAHRTLDSLILE